MDIYISFCVPDNTWNFLPLDITQSPTLSLFNNILCLHKTSRPSFFSKGKRYWKVIHTILRRKCILNGDIFKRNIINNMLCSCKKKIGLAKYLFLSLVLNTLFLKRDCFNAIFNISNQRTLVANIFVLLFKGTTWKMTRTNCHKMKEYFIFSKIIVLKQILTFFYWTLFINFISFKFHVHLSCFLQLIAYLRILGIIAHKIQWFSIF